MINACLLGGWLHWGNQAASHPSAAALREALHVLGSRRSLCTSRPDPCNRFSGQEWSLTICQSNSGKATTEQWPKQCFLITQMTQFKFLSSFKHLPWLSLLLCNENLPLKWQIVYWGRLGGLLCLSSWWQLCSQQASQRIEMYKRSLVGKEISLLSHLWSFIDYKKHWIVNIFIFTYVDIKPTSVVSKNCSTGTLVRMPTCLPLLVLPGELFWEERSHPCQKRLRRNSFQNQESWWRGSSFSSTQNFCCTSCVKEAKQLLGRFECTCLETAVPTSWIVGPDPAFQQSQRHMGTLQLFASKHWFDPCVHKHHTHLCRRMFFFSVADTTIQFILPFGLINVL